MKNILLFFFLITVAVTLNAQDVYGYWVGMINQGKKQFKFEIQIEKAPRNAPTLMRCRRCEKIQGIIADHREIEKDIDFVGIINNDASINIVDSKLFYKETFEESERTRYQFKFEVKGGEIWLVGYWQNYNEKGRKTSQGKVYLKRAKEEPKKA